jgi:response regulator RpfG family c-di-GMP phosphodiesterase
MIASHGLSGSPRRRDPAAAALSAVPLRAFGDTAWVTLALESCRRHLTPAIHSGKSHRIANAVLAVAHAPTPEQVDDVVGAACDTMLAEAYAARDSRLVSNVANARPVIETVMAELRERRQRDALAPALLRETVDAYLRLIALLDKRAAQRLEAVGDLAARIGYTMHQSSSVLLDIELAGRLHGVGMLSPAALPSALAAGEHAVIGETFLQSVPALAHLAPIVRSYQERFDGLGFPDGLSGDEIPFASRVIGVAAAFVDLITGSPEHEAVLPATACRKLQAAGGTRFDPRVVAATLQLLRFRQRTNRSA